MQRIVFALGILLAGLGLYVSLELIGVHARSHFGGGGDSGLCAALAGFSCDAASRSAFSEIAGLPIAVIGAGFYAALLVLLPLHRFNARAFPAVPEVFAVAGFGAVAYSLFLLGVSVFALGKVCPYCIALYGVNVGLLALALWGAPDGARALLRRLPGVWRRFEGVVFVVLVALGGLAFQGVYAQQSHAMARARAGAQADPTQPEGARVTLVTDGAASKGPADAPITIVEFSDFQCPFCQRFAETLETFAAQRTDVRIVFRHFPMDNACNDQIERKFHEFACGAARASVCAQAQGRFWPFHDRLFSNQGQLTPSDLRGHAEAVLLDLAAYDTCMADPATATRITTDIAEGVRVGLEGTPTFFVNGAKFVGGRSLEELQRIVEAQRGGGAPVSGSAK